MFRFIGDYSHTDLAKLVTGKGLTFQATIIFEFVKTLFFCTGARGEEGER